MIKTPLKSAPKFIGVHVLVQAPPGNFNRDDIGQVKTTVLGGKTRARWSDASQKRNARQMFAAAAPERLTGVRTVEVAELVTEHIMGNGLSPLDRDAVHAKVTEYLDPLFQSKNMEKNKAAALKAAEDVVKDDEAFQAAETVLGEACQTDGVPAAKIKKLEADFEKARKKLEASKDKAQKADDKLTSKALVYLSRPAVDAVARAALSGEKASKKGIATVLGSSVSVDMAAFGRMYAGDDTAPLNTDASVQVAHAISVGEFSQDVDFFTAMDDFTGHAAAMEYRYMGSPLMYRYCAVDTAALAKNLSMETDSDDFRDILELLVTCLVNAAPQGRKNSSGAVGRPSSVFLTVGDAPTILTAAFADPVELPAQAAERMLTTFSAYTKGYEMRFDNAAAWTMENVEASAAAASVTLAQSVPALISDTVRVATNGQG